MLLVVVLLVVVVNVMPGMSVSLTGRTVAVARATDGPDCASPQVTDHLKITPRVTAEAISPMNTPTPTISRIKKITFRVVNKIHLPTHRTVRTAPDTAQRVQVHERRDDHRPVPIDVG